MTKTFKILSIKNRNNLDTFNNVVTHVTYRVTATEDEIQAEYVGTCSLPLPSPGQFLDFSTLTEQEVINWIQGIINLPKLDEVLQKLIINKKYPEPVEVELPWNN
jgi:hypothetical protein